VEAFGGREPAWRGLFLRHPHLCGLRPQPEILSPKETKKAEKQEEDIETARKPSLSALFRLFSRSSGSCVLLWLRNVPRSGTPSPDPWHFSPYASSMVVRGPRWSRMVSPMIMIEKTPSERGHGPQGACPSVSFRFIQFHAIGPTHQEVCEDRMSLFGSSSFCVLGDRATTGRRGRVPKSHVFSQQLFRRDVRS